MDLLEVLRGELVAPVGKHAAPADRWELFRVADADETPTMTFDEGDELVEVLGRRHACLVEDQRGPRRHRDASACACAVIVPELGQGLGSTAGPSREDVSCLTRRGEADDLSVLARHGGDGVAHRRRLPRTGGPDDEDEICAAGHCLRGPRRRRRPVIARSVPRGRLTSPATLSFVAFIVVARITGAVPIGPLHSSVRSLPYLLQAIEEAGSRVGIVDKLPAVRTASAICTGSGLPRTSQPGVPSG